MRGAANVNVVTCTRLKWLDTGTEGLRYHASIPLYAHGKKMGVMNVASPDWRELSPDDLRILYTVGDMVGIAIERARLFTHSADIGAAQERNRIAREIHDTLAQGLTAIALQLETADALLDAKPESERAQKAVQQALELARSNLEEARRSVLDLRAAPLEGRTLPEALQSLLDDVSQRETITATLEISGDSRPLSSRLEMALYRAAQEAITNIVRHAHATSVEMEIVYAPDEVRLVLSDNGVGFDPDTIPGGRYGLIGLNERAHLLNGTFEVCSVIGEGTHISLAMPLENRQKDE
jgi:two-component system NarL family sensor kinase